MYILCCQEHGGTSRYVYGQEHTHTHSGRFLYGKRSDTKTSLSLWSYRSHRGSRCVFGTKQIITLRNLVYVLEAGLQFQPDTTKQKIF